MIEAASRPLLVEPGASGLDLHVFSEDAIFSGEGHAREWLIADIERCEVNIFPFKMRFEFIDGIGDMREVHELWIDRAIRRIAKPLDAVRVVGWVGHPAF